jgi:hypothetical protein
MITQEYTLGIHKIKIESVESLADAEKNGFKQGEYSRYFVDNKRTDNYMAMIRFIVDESAQNHSQMIPSGQTIIELRNKLFENQGKMLQEQIFKIRKTYQSMDLPDNVLIQVNEYLNKIDPVTNIRTIK